MDRAVWTRGYDDLLREADSEEMRHRLEGLAKSLVRRQGSDTIQTLWRMEVSQEQIVPPCAVHGEQCLHTHLQQPRCREVKQYSLQVAG